MNQKLFRIYNRIASVVVLLVAVATYLMTMEPTVSFWDCGEFIASSYKLEVGHAPGNPVFQIISRFLTMFVPAEKAAVAVNVGSALCSAFTIFFLYLTIVHLGRRILEKGNRDPYSTGNAIALIGASVVGSLAYCWSDTFWFSAVEAEVYAMSSLLTAISFWAILKWEEVADEEYADRWLVFIAFLMGLTIGVHLLSLLVIPPIALIYYYRRTPKATLMGTLWTLLISFAVIAVILWGIVPYVPKVAAAFDLLFVNTFGLGYNSGALFFVILLFVLSFLAVFLTRKYKKYVLHTISLAFTVILIAYSAFIVVVIRSVSNTPTNEGQPDNAFALVKYLSREQFGSTPLLYGPSFASLPYDYDNTTYHTALDGKYYSAPGPVDYIFPAESKMFFPRMHSRQPSHIDFYKSYMGNRGKILPGCEHKMPTFADNMKFFFDYQVNYMYFRYFMWNFAGRQNDLHGQVPGDLVRGNWECGIPFIDNMRLGDQSEGPDYIVNNESKNHYYLLPLILGIIGLLYQLAKDKKNWFVTMLLFLMTGLAIIVYLNQSPYQVRERDYAYAGSFYVFTIWIGLAVLSIYEKLSEWIGKGRHEAVIAPIVSVVLLFVPILMAAQNWDDHDRSNRYTARDMAYNFMESADPQAIIITHGDNDTFPLWYIQEVEGVGTDKRVMNTSLLGIDWYIDQMQCKQYESEPVRFTTPRINYLYGTNEAIRIYDRLSRPVTAKEAIELFNDPNVKISVNGEKECFLASRRIRVPVNKENVIKNGIVAPCDYDKIVDTLYLNISEGKSTLTKPELMILDMLSNYQWDRPVYILSQGGDINIGIKDYLQFDGFMYKLVPIKSRLSLTEINQVDTDKMYDLLMNRYRWDCFSKDFHVDYQNLVVFNSSFSQRYIFVQTAVALYRKQQKERAVEVLDKMQEVFPDTKFPLNTSIIYSVNEMMVVQAAEIYYKTGNSDKARELLTKFMDETLLSIKLFSKPYGSRSVISKYDLQTNFQLYQYGLELFDQFDKELADSYIEEIDYLLR